MEIYRTIMCIQSAFFLSHKIRKNTDLFLAFSDDQVLVHYKGTRLRYLGPDERSIGMLLMKALQKACQVSAGRERESTPGISIRRSSFQELLEDFDDRQVIVADRYSKKQPDKLRAEKVIFIIPEDEVKNPLLERGRQDYHTLGTQDLPQQMRGFLTILRFYSILDS